MGLWGLLRDMKGLESKEREVTSVHRDCGVRSSDKGSRGLELCAGPGPGLQPHWALLERQPPSGGRLTFQGSVLLAQTQQPNPRDSKPCPRLQAAQRVADGGPESVLGVGDLTPVG